jgi:hypothetical protein
MAAAIGRLVNGKFTATIVAPRLDSLELAVDRGKMSEEVLGRLRDRIGVRAASVVASRSGFLQICVDRYGNTLSLYPKLGSLTLLPYVLTSVVDPDPDSNS